MKYRVHEVHGNDYRCGCCRREWDVFSDFDTPEEVKEHLNMTEYLRRYKGIDRSVSEVFEYVPVEIEFDPETVERMISLAKAEEQQKLGESKEYSDEH